MYRTIAALSTCPKTRSPAGAECRALNLENRAFLSACACLEVAETGKVKHIDIEGLTSLMIVSSKYVRDKYVREMQ